MPKPCMLELCINEQIQGAYSNKTLKVWIFRSSIQLSFFTLPFLFCFIHTPRDAGREMISTTELQLNHDTGYMKFQPR